MPAVLTHFAFAKNNFIGDKRYHPITSLGAQGPDVFFFYGYSFAKRDNKKEVRAFGTMLHHSDITSFYAGLLSYASRQSEEEKDLYYSFIYGLFLHYILDRNVHPYVFYRTGFPSRQDEAFAYMYAHVYFETMMDCLVAKKYAIKPINKKAILNSDEDVKKISKMIYEVNLITFNFSYIKIDTYYKAYRDMLFMEGLFTSRTGFKRGIYRLLFYKTQLYPQTTMRQVKYNDILDVLNDRKDLWKDCVNGANHHESVLELFEIATKEIKGIKAILKDSRDGKKITKQLERFVSGINHDGFIVGARKRYMNYCFDKLPKKIVPYDVNN